jgi:hypothetical protein
VLARVPEPEFRRVREPKGNRIPKVHFIEAGRLRCEPESDEWFFNHASGTERVPAREFSGEQACILCYAALSGVSQQEAKLHLQGEQTLAEEALKRMPEVQEELPESAKPGAWIDRGEIWFDRDSGQIHYILRSAGGWTRHKVVGKDPKRKHFDQKLYELFADWLGLEDSDEEAEGA